MLRAAALGPPYAYIGCYTGGSNARGISVYHIDPTTNAMALVNIVAPVTSPSFIVLDAAKKTLYSGNESGAGSVSAFSVRLLASEMQLGESAWSQLGPIISVTLKLSFALTFACESLLISTLAVSVIGQLHRSTGSRLVSSSVLKVPSAQGRWCPMV